MKALALSARDIEETKGREASNHFRIVRIEQGDAELFERAFGALHAEFAPRGELERRDVVESWLRAPLASYHLLAALDSADLLAAVRDCHIRIDEGARAAVAYLAHVLVLPPYRRSGVAALMRAAPLALARDGLAVAGKDGTRTEEWDVLLAAEMEPADRSGPETLVRLVAYGKAGFRAIAPSALPYCQPDFRDLAASGEAPRPLPLVAIVRRVGRESATTLPKALARAYVENLYAVFGSHVRAPDLEAPARHALETLAAFPGDEVPLLPLPRDERDADAIEPLLRENVLRHHMASVRSAR